MPEISGLLGNGDVKPKEVNTNYLCLLSFSKQEQGWKFFFLHHSSRQWRSQCWARWPIMMTWGIYTLPLSVKWVGRVSDSVASRLASLFDANRGSKFSHCVPTKPTWEVNVLDFVAKQIKQHLIRLLLATTWNCTSHSQAARQLNSVSTCSFTSPHFHPFTFDSISFSNRNPKRENHRCSRQRVGFPLPPPHNLPSHLHWSRQVCLSLFSGKVCRGFAGDRTRSSRPMAARPWCRSGPMHNGPNIRMAGVYTVHCTGLTGALARSRGNCSTGQRQWWRGDVMEGCLASGN